MTRRLVFALSALAIGCASRGRSARGVPPSGPIHLAILGVNDFHGSIDEQRVAVATSGGGSVELRVGGAALLASYLEKSRELDPDGTLLLSAGDMWQGTREPNSFEGRPIVQTGHFLRC